MALHADTHLRESVEAIVRLLERHRVLEALAQRQEGHRRELVEQLQRRQNLYELERHLRGLHPADAAHVLEALPLDDRRTAWEQLGSDSAAAVFVELSEAVRSSIADDTPRERLIDILIRLDPEDLAYVSTGLPPDVLGKVSRLLEATERSIFDESVQYPPTSVGHLMTREWVETRESQTIGDALAELRVRGSLPAQTDHLYVVDVRHILRGAVPVHAFVASRVIGRFEVTIQQLAALAALMPIVASIGGNTGNQTMTLVIRGLAVDQIPIAGIRPLLRKELLVATLNGAVWGSLVGLFAVAMYLNLKLGLVMGAAVVLNLVVAAAAGVLVPIALHAIGRDPAHGSSVLVTFMTDAMGFFLFLGLATLFLT